VDDDNKKIKIKNKNGSQSTDLQVGDVTRSAYICDISFPLS
jgi:hypothetical protein